MLILISIRDEKKSKCKRHDIRHEKVRSKYIRIYHKSDMMMPIDSHIAFHGCHHFRYDQIIRQVLNYSINCYRTKNPSNFKLKQISDDASEYLVFLSCSF